MRRLLRREQVERGRPGAAAAPAAGDDADVEFLRAALADLSVAQRAVLSLHYLEGHGVERIAEILGIPAGTVKSRLHHARAALKKKLERRTS